MIGIKHYVLLLWMSKNVYRKLYRTSEWDDSSSRNVINTKRRLCGVPFAELTYHRWTSMLPPIRQTMQRKCASSMPFRCRNQIVVHFDLTIDFFSQSWIKIRFSICKHLINERKTFMMHLLIKYWTRAPNVFFLFLLIAYCFDAVSLALIAFVCERIVGVRLCVLILWIESKLMSEKYFKLLYLHHSTHSKLCVHQLKLRNTFITSRDTKIPNIIQLHKRTHTKRERLSDRENERKSSTINRRAIIIPIVTINNHRDSYEWLALNQ